MSRSASGARGGQGVQTLALLITVTGPVLAAPASAPKPADTTTGSLIRAVKEIESKLGFHRGSTFDVESNEEAADYRCYYTGKLELPEDYDALRLKRGSAQGCNLNSRKYDVFFYPLQAMATPKMPVTTSLARSSPERVLMVIPHEDFHQDPALSGLPGSLTEAAATLVGFLTAREVAREQFGAESEIYRNLSGEAERFLNKSRLVNHYFDTVHQLYADHRAKGISKEEVLDTKARLFEAVERQCAGMEPKPSSFNRCLAANNNAGLAFDHTYTLYYPLVYGVAEAKREDLKATIDALKQAMIGHPAGQAIENLRLAGHLPASPLKVASDHH